MGRGKREEGRAGLLKLELTIVKIEGGEGPRMRGMGNVKDESRNDKRESYTKTERTGFWGAIERLRGFLMELKR